MNKIKGIITNYRNCVISGVCIILACILALVSGNMEKSLSSQNIARRWSSKEDFTEVSVFFSREAHISKNALGGVRNHIRSTMVDSVDLDEYQGRYYIDTYATQNTVSLCTDKVTMEVRGFGVGGDFFLFHPIELIDGNYFDEATDSNLDGVVIDENLAWKLFGAKDVAGMTVSIGDRCYVIRGVVKQDDGLFSEAVEETIPTVYMQYSVMNELFGGELYIDSYEALIADPVRDFALNTVNEAVSEAIGVDEKDYNIIENSKRFTVGYKIKHLKTMFLDSMNLKNICLPYWENKARGVEQITLRLFILCMILMVYPVIYISYRLIKLISYTYKKYITTPMDRIKD